jgi:hypothetical protein
MSERVEVGAILDAGAISQWRVTGEPDAAGDADMVCVSAQPWSAYQVGDTGHYQTGSGWTRVSEGALEPAAVRVGQVWRSHGTLAHHGTNWADWRLDSDV